MFAAPSQPSQQNGYLSVHTLILLQSFQRWTGRNLLQREGSPEQLAYALFEAPFIVVSHNTAADPIFNYGNRAALTLFEMSWDEFTTLPSRQSAEPLHRDERSRLLDEVIQTGFTTNYQGTRISKSGRRFYIHKAIVWNLLDERDYCYGQAATFSQWTYLE
jgi:hypothetical protein